MTSPINSTDSVAGGSTAPSKKLFGRAFSELSPLNPKVLAGQQHSHNHSLVFPNWSIFRHVRSSSVQVTDCTPDCTVPV